MRVQLEATFSLRSRDLSHRENIKHPEHSPSPPSASRGDDCVEMFLSFTCWSWGTHGGQFKRVATRRDLFRCDLPLACLVWLVCTARLLTLCVLPRSFPFPFLLGGRGAPSSKVPVRRSRVFRYQRSCGCSSYQSSHSFAGGALRRQGTGASSRSSCVCVFARWRCLCPLASCVLLAEHPLHKFMYFIPHAQASLEFFISVSPVWDITKQEAAAVSTTAAMLRVRPSAPSKRSSQVVAKRDTTHGSIGMAEAPWSSLSCAAPV